MRRLLQITPLLLTGALCAQFVSPAYHAKTEGLSNNVFPFGTSTPFRYLQVHDDVPSGPILSLSFRQNAGTVNILPNSVTCDIWLSTALTTSATVSSTFDNNHGTNKTQVATAQVYNHPLLESRIVPAPFGLKYPHTPFAFPGSASLCWEVQVTARSTTSGVTHDAIAAATANPALQVGVGGRGCFATGYNLPVGASGSSTMSWSTNSGTLTVTGSNLPLLTPVVHTLGTDPFNWGSLTLPFEIPGTANAPSRTCSFYNDSLLTVSLTSTATGTASSSVAIPAFPYLHGLTIYSQLWAIDAPANVWGLVTSPGVGHNYVAPTTAPPLVRVYLSGSLGAVGTTGPNSGLVTKFN